MVSNTQIYIVVLCVITGKCIHTVRYEFLILKTWREMMDEGYSYSYMDTKLQENI